MKKFLVVYYAPAEAMQRMYTATEEEKAEGMKAWETWLGAHQPNILDFGAPIAQGEGTADAESWSPSTKEVSGYGLVQANSLEEAKALFKGHPHIGWHPGATIEVYECINMGNG